MYPSGNSHLTYEDDEVVAFFSGPFDPLNNFSAHTVTIWDKTFYTVEHAFQWKKFADTDPETAKNIFQAGSPWLAKKISKTSSNRHPQWGELKVDIMKEIVKAKVDQHEDVKDILLKTGNKQIIENSPEDSFWGYGANGNGENIMGKILVEIRETIR